MTTIVPDEKKTSLKNAIIQLCIDSVPRDGPPAVIRTDGAPSFQSIAKEDTLSSYNIRIEIGRTKNPNKNPIAERAIQELEDELLRVVPRNDRINQTTLAIATAQINSRVRSSGLSSRELWLQRDQYTNAQLPIKDYDVINEQHERRLTNHTSSEMSKANGLPRALNGPMNAGDIVYLLRDKQKHHLRDRYIVTSLEGDTWCNIRKFSGSQLRNTSYRVKRSDLFQVQPYNMTRTKSYTLPDQEDESDDILSYHDNQPTYGQNEYLRAPTHTEHSVPTTDPVDPVPLPEYSPEHSVPTTDPVDPVPLPEYSPEHSVPTTDPVDPMPLPEYSHKAPSASPPVPAQLQIELPGANHEVRPERSRKAPSYLKDYVTNF
jgi:hypothetical protein